VNPALIQRTRSLASHWKLSTEKTVQFQRVIDDGRMFEVDYRPTLANLSRIRIDPVRGLSYLPAPLCLMELSDNINATYRLTPLAIQLDSDRPEVYLSTGICNDGCTMR
jgi:hypothetical protein